MIKAVITDRGAVFDLAPQCGSLEGNGLRVQILCFVFYLIFTLFYQSAPTTLRPSSEMEKGTDRFGSVSFGWGYKMILRTSVCVCFPCFSRNKNTLATTSNTLISFKNKIDEIIAPGAARPFLPPSWKITFDG